MANRAAFFLNPALAGGLEYGQAGDVIDPNLRDDELTRFSWPEWLIAGWRFNAISLTRIRGSCRPTEADVRNQVQVLERVANQCTHTEMSVLISTASGSERDLM